MLNVRRSIGDFPQRTGAVFTVLITFALIVTASSCAKPKTTENSRMNQRYQTESAPYAKLTAERLKVSFDPAAHSAEIVADLDAARTGPFDLQLPAGANIREVVVNGTAVDDPRPLLLNQTRKDANASASPVRLRIRLDQPKSVITLRYSAVFDDDPSKGEVVGQIHNFSVSAHVGEDGIFLSDNAGWHPVWIDPKTNLAGMIRYSIQISPMPGWSIVASGNPYSEQMSPSDGLAPTWSWGMPRLIDGMAIVGGKQVVQSRVHQTEFGPVELVMQVKPENEQFIPIFLDAAVRYIDLYTPILGPFPYKRFSIVENFFSSGFAFPGFTLLGPRVVPMGERALAPGYLDHEMIHNWWGNGVYIDPNRGNWCEALTSYCANYYRRVLDDGESAGRDYRRGILMKLAGDPENLDNAPVDRFGVDSDVNRFVGYDKGSFIFMMLEAPTPDSRTRTMNRERVFAALRAFSTVYLGKRATWDDLRRTIEIEFGTSKKSFFDTWVHQRTIPLFHDQLGMKAIDALKTRISPDQHVDYVVSKKGDISYLDIDPDFYIYRLIPESKIVPTVGGTIGQGGMKAVADRSESSTIEEFLARMQVDPKGANLLILGKKSARDFADLLESATDPITFDEHSFTVGGKRYDGENQAVLHTMQYPGREGRFITVFLTNSDAGWSHLTYITFYTRDTTIIWDGRHVARRRTFEPDRRIRLPSP